MSLWVPESAFAADERAVDQMLRAYDPELRLVPQPTPTGLAYQVRRYCGPDRPSEFLFFWCDEHGDALPLSSRILDLVAEHDKSTRERKLDADAKNALKQAREDKGWEDDVAAIRDDWLPSRGRPILPRSQSLRRSRDKQRAQGKNV